MRQPIVCVGGHAGGELAEEIVGDQRPAARIYLRSGTQCIERLERAVAHSGAVDRKHLGDLVVASPALQHEREHRALICRKRI